MGCRGVHAAKVERMGAYMKSTLMGLGLCLAVFGTMPGSGAGFEAWAQATAEEPVSGAATAPEAETDAATVEGGTRGEASPAGPVCPLALDEDGQPITDPSGEPVYNTDPVAVVDPETGAPVLDEAGAPLTQPCILPGEVDAGEEAPDAEALGAASETAGPGPLARLLAAGGPIIVILAILAVLSLGVALVKLIQFLWLGVGRVGFVAPTVARLRAHEADAVIEALDRQRNPVARVMAAAIRGRSNPRMSDDLVREETTRVAQAQLDGLERGLALLGLVATIAPLLGLLGTVLGMIEAFQQMETVGDRVEPAVLAGGIWEALLTTAAGLSVAIPAAVFVTWFQRAADVVAQRMEDAATQVFTAPLYDAADGPGAVSRPPAAVPA